MRVEINKTLTVTLTEGEALGLIRGGSTDNVPVIYRLRTDLSKELGVPLAGYQSRWGNNLDEQTGH